jgi:hypothetical protein
MGTAAPAQPAAAADRRTRLFPLVVAGLGTLYLLQAISPIRLDNDSVVHLRTGARLADGYASDVTSSPLGYPAFIAMLDRLGLGMSFVFVLANCAFTALGLVCASHLFRDRRANRRSWVVPLTMLAFLVIRYLPMPLPETMFFGVSLAAVAAMNASSARESAAGRVRLLCVALVLTAAAITLRMMGFVLVPALLFACFLSAHRGRAALAKVTSPEWVFVSASLIVIALVAFALGDSFERYSSEAGLIYLHGDLWGQMWRHVQGLLWTIGALVINLPWTQFQPYRSAFLFAGLVAVVWIFSTVRFRLPRTPAAVYLVSFLVLLVLWPYNAQRLWLPIVPLLIGYAERASFRFTPGRKWRLFVRAYVAWFAFAGLGALAYTTRITFSGNDFSKVYGKAGGMSFPDPRTGKIDTLHNHRARELQRRYGNPF